MTALSLTVADFHRLVGHADDATLSRTNPPDARFCPTPCAELSTPSLLVFRSLEDPRSVALWSPVADLDAMIEAGRQMESDPEYLGRTRGHPLSEYVDMLMPLYEAGVRFVRVLVPLETDTGAVCESLSRPPILEVSFKANAPQVAIVHFPCHSFPEGVLIVKMYLRRVERLQLEERARACGDAEIVQALEEAIALAADEKKDV